MASPFIPCLLDLQKFVVSKDCVCDWKLHTQLPAGKPALSDWEAQNGWRLPEDLRAFYQTTDGLSFSYCAQVGDAKVRIAAFSVNSVEQLRPLGSSCDLTLEKMSVADADATDSERGWLDTSLSAAAHGDCGIFELEPLDGQAAVCLVLRQSSADVHLLDRSLRLHWLAASFSDYYCLALAHLGLLQWQFCLTDIGASPAARQWLQLLAPLRLQLDKELMLGDSPLDNQRQLLPQEPCRLDQDRVFKGKVPERKKVAGGAAAGQAAPPAAKSPSNATKRYAAPTRNSAGKSAAAVAAAAAAKR